MELQERIADVLSKILSEKYDCKVTIKLHKRSGIDSENQHSTKQACKNTPDSAIS